MKKIYIILLPLLLIATQCNTTNNNSVLPTKKLDAQGLLDRASRYEANNNIHNAYQDYKEVMKTYPSSKYSAKAARGMLSISSDISVKYQNFEKKVKSSSSKSQKNSLIEDYLNSNPPTTYKIRAEKLKLIN